MNVRFDSPLISPEWLLPRLDQEACIVLDASFFLPGQGMDAKSEFLKGHLPGAQFFDIDEVADTSSDLPHMLPSASVFGAAVGELGIGPKTPVVIYDQNHFMASARLWWTFRVFDHQPVYVLDGGLERWKALGFPLSEGPSKSRLPQDFVATLTPGLFRDLADIRVELERRRYTLVDARPQGRFQGIDPEPRAGLRQGHIPGSLNVFFKDVIDLEHKTLKPPSVLSTLFREKGIDPLSPIITTCGSGVTAAILSLALYTIGNERVPVYDGSWAEWGSRTDTPIETGP